MDEKLDAVARCAVDRSNAAVAAAPRICPIDGLSCPGRKPPKAPKVLPKCAYPKCTNLACSAPHPDHPQRGYCLGHSAQMRRHGPAALAPLRYRSPRGTRIQAKRITIPAIDGLSAEDAILAVAERIRDLRRIVYAMDTHPEDGRDDHRDPADVLADAVAAHGRLAPHPTRPVPDLLGWIARHAARRVCLRTLDHIRRSMAGLVADGMQDLVPAKRIDQLLRQHKVLAEVSKMASDDEITNKIKELQQRLEMVELNDKSR